MNPFRALRRRQTVASFDYQWGELPDGDAMLSDPWFLEKVDRILAEELLGVERDWFRGRRALDAGCGGGRWSLGLIRLGCDVLAVDYSERALEQTRVQIDRLASASQAGKLRTERVDLLKLPESLSKQKFDLVFSFGVLHHTGDTRKALGNLASLVAPDGLLFLYLYGPINLFNRVFLAALRGALAPLPFSMKRSLLRKLFSERDLHQTFDLFSPVVNARHDRETVRGWLNELGFPHVETTLPHSELFLRAWRETCSAFPFRERLPPPFWFERYRRRRSS